MHCTCLYGTHCRLAENKALQPQLQHDHLVKIELIRLMNRDDHRDQVSTCFPLIYTFAYFYDFAGRFMSRATLQVEAISDNGHSINSLKGRSDFIGNHHRIANPSMLPEVNIAPTNWKKKASTLTIVTILESLPADTSSTHMKQYLTRAWFWTRFFDKMNFMCWIVKRGDVGLGRWFLVRCQYTKQGVI